MKAWILSLKPRFFLVMTRKIHTVPLKIDGVDFPWKSGQLGMHEGSSLCLWSISDGQRLFGKRRSCCKPRGVDPSSLGKQSTLKNKLPGRGVWTATDARITPSITPLAALWDKAWACNQDNASINSAEEVLRPQTATFYCSLGFIYKNLRCQRRIQANFRVSDVTWLLWGFANQQQTLHLFLWTRSSHVFLTAVRCWHRRMFWGGVCWSESGWRCGMMIGRRVVW